MNVGFMKIVVGIRGTLRACALQKTLGYSPWASLWCNLESVVTIII